MKHLISLPSGAGPHPLLCFLHGYDEAAPAPLATALMRHGPLNASNLPHVRERFVVLAPQLPVAGDHWHRYSDELHELVATVLDEHEVDADRMFLTGFSFGGNGVFDIAALQGHWWHALWAVDPTRVPERDPDRPVWVTAGAVVRSQGRAFIDGLNLSLDPQAERVYDDEGDDHVGAAQRAYADERIYAWLLKVR